MSHRDDGDESPDEIMDINEVNLHIDNIHQETQESENTRDDDSGYSSQHSMENDEDKETEIERILKLISQIAVYNKNIKEVCRNTLDTNIVTATMECSKVVRKDKSDHYDNFQHRIKEQMDRSISGQNSEKKKYLIKAFQQLVIKVSEKQSWRAFINVINVIGLVKSVAESSECFDKQLKDELEFELNSEFISFSKRTYEEFFTETGGFVDIIDYLKSVKDYDKGLSPGLTGMAIAASGVALMGAFLFGRS